MENSEASLGKIEQVSFNLVLLLQRNICTWALRYTQNDVHRSISIKVKNNKEVKHPSPVDKLWYIPTIEYGGSENGCARITCSNTNVSQKHLEK